MLFYCATFDLNDSTKSKQTKQVQQKNCNLRQKENIMNKIVLKKISFPTGNAILWIYWF